MTSVSVDLQPAAQRLTELIGGVSDHRLGEPTPCPDYTLGDLLDHVGGFALAFTAAARKATPPTGGERASGDASRLGDDWRTRIPRDLAGLAEAWRDPAAWTGMTRAGGVDLPGEVAGLIALEELVVHGWDVARASGQDYGGDPDSLAVVHGYLVSLTSPEMAQLRDAIFAPVVEVPDDAPLVDRVVGLSGRDPAWRAHDTPPG